MNQPSSPCMYWPHLQLHLANLLPALVLRCVGPVVVSVFCPASEVVGLPASTDTR